MRIFALGCTLAFPLRDVYLGEPDYEKGEITASGSVSAGTLAGKGRGGKGRLVFVDA